MALAVLKVVQVSRWADLPERLPGIVADGDLLAAHAEVLAFLVIAGRKVMATIAACDTCGRWLCVGSSAPSRCTLTVGCPGSMVKARPAPAKQ